MLFLKIKIILSAKHLFAPNMRGLVFKSWKSHPIYGWQMCGGFFLNSQLPQGQVVWEDPPRRGPGPQPYPDQPSPQLIPIKESKGRTFLILPGSYLPSFQRMFRWGNLKLRINRSPLLLLSGSQWRILSAEQHHGNQIFKAFFKNTSQISSGNIPITQLD